MKFSDWYKKRGEEIASPDYAWGLAVAEVSREAMTKLADRQDLPGPDIMGTMPIGSTGLYAMLAPILCELDELRQRVAELEARK